MSETANRPPGLRTRNASRNTGVFVAREVDDAVRDDDVGGVARQRDALDVAAQELDVRRAGLRLVLVGEREHLVRHVEAVRLARRADALGGEQHVDAAARSEIEHDLAGTKLRERRRIAAAERSKQRLGWEAGGVVRAVEISRDRIGVEPERRVFGRRAAARRLRALHDRFDRLAVLLLHDLANVHFRLGLATARRAAGAGALGLLLLHVDLLQQQPLPRLQQSSQMKSVSALSVS